MMLSQTRGRIILSLICGVLFSGNAGATTGHEWKKWSPDCRTTYVMGVTDTWQNVETVRRASNPQDETPSIFAPLIACMRQRMTYIQITAIVNKYLEDNPSEWHYDMASLVWTAMSGACKRTEEKGR
jgi:hypothetical protein